MSKGKCYGLMFAGIAFLLGIVLAASGPADAAGVTGTYRSTNAGEGATDATGAADFIYDATLTLTLGGGGSLTLKCTDIIEHIPGFADFSMIGKSQTESVQWTSSGSSVTVSVAGTPLTFHLTLSGDRLTGTGSYVGGVSETNSWTMDVTKGGSGGGGGGGGGGVAGWGTFGYAAGLASAFTIGGGLAALSASMLPPPRFMGGSILPANNTVLGTPYAPSQSLGSLGNQGQVTRPIPDVPKMRFPVGPIEFPNVQMGQQTVVQPTEVRPTDVLSKRFCPNCGAQLTASAAGWGCPFCHRAPPGGLDPQ